MHVAVLEEDVVNVGSRCTTGPSADTPMKLVDIQAQKPRPVRHCWIY
jgi:hypothetical protein